MNKNGHRFTCFLLGSIMTAISLTGCSTENISKTIVLSEEESRREGTEVKDIKEYTYEGISKDIGHIAWNEEEAGTFRILTAVSSGEYIYGVEDIYMEAQDNQEKGLIDKRIMSQVKMAPGGGYVSYEVWENQVSYLILYRTEDAEQSVLREWKDDMEVFQYAWSDDGTKLFAWQDGNDYGQDTYDEWKVYRYDMETGLQTEVRLKGIGSSYRMVLPNWNGTCVYIVEERISAKAEKNNEADNQFLHRVADMETGEVKELGWWDADEAWPIKYTEEGMYAQNLDGTISIYKGLFGEVEKKELFAVDYRNVRLCICEHGDHIFLIEWDSDSRYMQVSSVNVKDGEIVGRQVIYKGISGVDAEAAISPNDDAIAIQSSEYIEDDRWRFKITVLEY